MAGQLSRLMSSHGRGKKPCPLCEESGFGGDVLCHLLSEHGQEMVSLNLTVEEVIGKIKNCDLEFVYGTCMCFS